MRKANQSNNQQNEVMSSYLQEDENYDGFSNQLAALGLKLRDIPGDGNCLFRALADQLEGHSRNHRRHRTDTVRYMIDHRCDFEPFVEDDCSFEDHVYKLRQDGTYAGNDAIVAFARRNGINVVIHQLNAPMWTINGSDRSNIAQLHIAYHNGDHYSSVRKINDNSDNPAGVKLLTKPEKKQHLPAKRDSKRKLSSPPSVVKKQIQHVSNVTGCQDSKLIYQLLEENDYDITGVIQLVLQILPSPVASDEETEATFKPHSSKSNTDSHSNLWDASGTGSRIFGSQNIKSKQQESRKKVTTPPRKLSNKRRKEELKKERKKRSEEKKKNGSSTSQSNLSDSDDSTIILKNVEILKI